MVAALPTTVEGRREGGKERVRESERGTSESRLVPDLMAWEAWGP